MMEGALQNRHRTEKGTKFALWRSPFLDSGALTDNSTSIFFEGNPLSLVINRSVWCLLQERGSHVRG